MVTKVIYYLIFFVFLMIVAGPIPAGALVINEIHFNPPSFIQDDDGEFLELYNEGSAAMDLTGYTIEGISVSLQGIIIGAGGFLVLASEAVDDDDNPDLDSFDTIYGNGDGLLTEFPFPVVDFTGSLANTGEVLTLYGSDRLIVDRYDYTPFISSGAGGGGFSLERIDPQGLSVDTNFKVSEIPGGTPGRWNSVASLTTSGNVAPVPEPATGMLLATGLLLRALGTPYLPLNRRKRKGALPEC